MLNYNSHKIRRHNKVKGFALVLLLMVIPVIFLIAVTVHEKLMHDFRFSNYNLDRKRAFYIAQAAERAASYDLAGSNFSRYTHNESGSPLTGLGRLPITIPNSYVDSGGWTAWEWKPSDGNQPDDPHSSFTKSGKAEKYRYKIQPEGETYWKITAEGYYGDYKRTIVVRGQTEGAFHFTLFANESLSEFVRGRNQTITGKVHSNGDLYFRPTGTTLRLHSDRVSAAGKMIRFEDAWRRPDRGGTVMFENNASNMVMMEGYSQGHNGKGRAYDYYHAHWQNDDPDGALKKYDARVIDGSLGAGVIEPPNLESIADGGFYSQHASLKITSSSYGDGVSDASFYNMAEERYENVKDIDMSKLPYPANGLIYANTPIRLINAHELPGALTIVSNSTVYTKGDVNKVYGSEDDYKSNTITKKPFAILTSARIYHLSNGWKDSQNNNHTNRVRRGKDKPLYDGDENNVVEINAALVDGAPQVDEINYVKEWNGVENPRYTGRDDANNACWANSDDFLENLSGITMKKRGSIVHLENAQMAELDNSNVGPGVTAWVMNTHYNPPVREYSYDPDLKNPLRQPPFFPYVSRKISWKVTN